MYCIFNYITYIYHIIHIYCYLVYFSSLLNVFLVDTGRKLNVHETLRGRPGRLLNVLCPLNLPPMSTGTNSAI